jgi:hypothetical protein
MLPGKDAGSRSIKVNVLDSNDLASAFAYAEGSPASVPTAMGANRNLTVNHWHSARQRESAVNYRVARGHQFAPSAAPIAAHKRRQIIEPEARFQSCHPSMGGNLSPAKRHGEASCPFSVSLYESFRKLWMAKPGLGLPIFLHRFAKTQSKTLTQRGRFPVPSQNRRSRQDDARHSVRAHRLRAESPRKRRTPRADRAWAATRSC